MFKYFVICQAYIRKSIPLLSWTFEVKTLHIILVCYIDILSVYTCIKWGFIVAPLSVLYIFFLLLLRSVLFCSLLSLCVDVVFFLFFFIIYFCGGTVTDKTDRLGVIFFFRLAPTFKSVQISFTFLCSTFVCWNFSFHIRCGWV